MKTQATLKKLSQSHFIIYDNSDIKEGDWFLPVGGIGWKVNIPRRADENGGYNNSHCKKITHSTQPNKGMENVTFISPMEVEELIDGYSVEKMAKYHYGNNRGTREFEDGFMLGFKIAHKELVKDKLFTVEDMKEAFDAGAIWEGGEAGESKEESFNRQLKDTFPKTEWNVAFDENGKN